MSYHNVILCRNYLLCSHPHGVLSAGAFCCFATEGTNFSEVSCFVISMVQFGCCLFWSRSFLCYFFYDLFDSSAFNGSNVSGIHTFYKWDSVHHLVGPFFDCLNRFPLDDINLILKVFPGISPHLLVLEQMFWIPFFRDLWSTTGSVAATKVWQTIKADKLPFIFSIGLLTYPCVC